MRTPVALAALALLLAGCIAPVASPPESDVYPAGSTAHTMEWDGLDRSYRVYVPTDLGEGPVELIVMLHGGFGSAQQAELVYGWDAQAEQDGVVVAYPDGTGRSWNAGGCCGAAAASDVDDVGFVEAMVAEIAQGLDIDPARIYAAGMSNGGMMAYRLACESDLFAAIGAVSATMLVDCDAPGPVSVMHIHGALDASVPPDGSPGAGTQQIDGPPLADVLAYWRERDGCGDPVTGQRDDPQVRVVEATECAEGTAVVYLEIADAGHQWPGARSSEIREELGGDPPSRRLDATAELAAFFAGHPRG
jgi:polyhydroxybutyrate depolymerase